MSPLLQYKSPPDVEVRPRLEQCPPARWIQARDAADHET